MYTGQLGRCLDWLYYQKSGRVELVTLRGTRALTVGPGRGDTPVTFEGAQGSTHGTLGKPRPIAKLGFAQLGEGANMPVLVCQCECYRVLSGRQRPDAIFARDVARL